ncbi:MFS superfamily sulfate permease-like transporter [Neolewinella xylanilytica]|uniref:MFS superfamily sulfate permease-like transporter n=1 Tax=Neolewinella xylanilytica TaxID=1514080 RepID=A0A2S6I6Z8_9BACT|nr:SulP family inorganic anion transporter [Neolewinella xylanilytica]PPK87273.1 MFS superfamily sulfate permease-like transporter [Neolewinella xylanilytica]
MDRTSSKRLGLFDNLAGDVPASVVVFFVAIPLCLGIALASGAPLFSGLIAGIIGGIVVGAVSGSPVGVSGPAAGLTAIVLTAITDLGSYELFLTCVVIGGVLQVAFGLLRAGVIGYFFPSSVIKGMLTGIGLIIILKQIPHFFGYDADPEGDDAFLQPDGENTFSEIFNLIDYTDDGATTIAFIALGILILWEAVLKNKGKIFTILPGPLVAVGAGIVWEVTMGDGSLGIAREHLVSVPVPESFDDFVGQFSFPDFSAVSRLSVWVTGFTIALVASLETLLCVEATDKLDPRRRVTPTNRELLAQGTGNIISGLIGGLPVTQVIVRSSANIQSGGRTKLAAILHGVLLLVSVIFVPGILNLIPLSVLAAILLLVGYKLAKPTTFVSIYRSGWRQFVPFIVTVVAIVFTDLLIGISLGLAVGIIVILYTSYQNSHFLHMTNEEGQQSVVNMTLAEEVTFFNKGAIRKQFDEVPEGALLRLDIRQNQFLDHDVVEIMNDFVTTFENRNIDVEVIKESGSVMNPQNYFDVLEMKHAGSSAH